MNWIDRHRREVQVGIVWDLVRFDLLSCKLISSKPDTRKLASLPTHPLSVATVTMPTAEPDQCKPCWKKKKE